MSVDLKKELEEKKAKRDELIKSRPKAGCSEINSSEIDVRRETEIEDLDEAIEDLEQRIRG